MTKVKICGITNLKDAQTAVRYGADAIGFVFTESPRQISPEKAREISENLPGNLIQIGVFVNPSCEELSQVDWLTGIQLHGTESPDFLGKVANHLKIKAFRVKQEEDLKVLSEYQEAADAFLLDSAIPGILGGTGKSFDWSLAMLAKKYRKPIFLAGGLNPQNVSQAISQIKPDWVDVSSGVEEIPGKKNIQKVEEFIKNVIQADVSAG